MKAIEIEGLNKSYAGFTLEDVNLTLPTGSILGLVGENGAGKSTTIRLIMNAASRDSGTVRVLGTDNRDAAFDAVKEDIGVVLDEAYFPESLTARRLGRVMRATYLHWNDQIYTDFLRSLSLPADKEFKEFSRGMKMKLAIAVALSHEPKLLILDEATSGLDPMAREEILELFNDFTRDENHSILMSSHIISDLEKSCDYIAFLHRGRLLFCEEKDRLLETYALAKVSPEQFEALPEDAVRGVRRDKYGMEALVLKDAVSKVFPTERPTLEDVLLFLAKGEDAR